MFAVGFTGTSRGMTAAQRAQVRDVLARYRASGATHFHHGDCVGADAEAHTIAKGLGFYVVLHPPSDPKARAYATGDEARPLAPYLIRNRAIVLATQCLVATPSGETEERRSGTWATVRYARKEGRQVTLIFPDGRSTGTVGGALS